MNQNTVTGDYININLRQLGATSIKEFNSIMHIAEFDLGDGLIVSYVFNITRHNKYFLQRMQPYAMVHGKFASDQEIIDFITADLKLFLKMQRIVTILYFPFNFPSWSSYYRKYRTAVFKL